LSQRIFPREIGWGLKQCSDHFLRIFRPCERDIFMGRSKGWKALFLLAIQVCCLGIAGGVCGAQGSAQNAADADQSKILFHLGDTSATAPVKVTHVFVGDHEVALDTPVAVKGMWVRNVKVIVENVSPKDVVEGGILVLFPETGTGAPDKSDSHYGGKSREVSRKCVPTKRWNKQKAARL
jgi:hypothetical protein